MGLPAFRTVVAAAAFASLAGPSATEQAKAEPFSFRGVALGSTLADLRRLRYPEVPTARILCSHDAEAREVRPTEEFSAAGPEGVCSAFVFARVIGPTTSGLPPEWLPARVKVGSIEVSPTFWFVPGEDGRLETSGRLYRISMRSNTAFWTEALDAFTRRYGKPHSIEKSTFPAYKPVENETATWANAESTIRLVKRAGRVSRMTIDYEHNTLTPAGSGADASPDAPPKVRPGSGPAKPG